MYTNTQACGYPHHMHTKHTDRQTQHHIHTTRNINKITRAPEKSRGHFAYRQCFSICVQPRGVIIAPRRTVGCEAPVGFEPSALRQTVRHLNRFLNNERKESQKGQEKDPIQQILHELTKVCGAQSKIERGRGHLFGHPGVICDLPDKSDKQAKSWQHLGLIQLPDRNLAKANSLSL